MKIKYNLFLVLLIIISCSNSSSRSQIQYSSNNKEKKILENINIILLKKEMKTIKNYVDSLGLDMKISGKGMWYRIIEKGEGRKPEMGSKIVIEYEVKLMDGTICYSSDSSGVRSFKVDMNQEIRGINEAVKLIGTGGEIQVILPRHLGLGLMGDLKKVPPMQILICRIKLVDIDSY